ncbi:hypothetical protein M378DRAFT_165556 [Amanita muscaria Koide BX008]|uniref:Uncharacterized protein n=1 Tax=Amanita muscaria (strain Koide BX008) TaxID=946122 RepID=A0A0C2X093_AMAMK|nr:hypothetical protein M378DRAFT_165556 [Amanita muscaria Koide BX008]
MLSLYGYGKILEVLYFYFQAPLHSPEGGVEAGVLRPSGSIRYMRNQHPAALTV